MVRTLTLYLILISLMSGTLYAKHTDVKKRISPELAAQIQKLETLKPDPSIDVEFVIVVPMYNNEMFYQGNLDSLISQHSSQPYQIIIINDCSTDDTGHLVENYIERNNLSSWVQVIHHENNVGLLAGMYNVVHSFIPDHKVVVNVDGDDQLINNYVLLRLEQEYKKTDTWMTYGHYIRTYSAQLGDAERASRRFLEQRTLRKQKRFRLSHLKTFKAGLFKKLKKEDLMYKGKFFTSHTDGAMMYPMIEMCAPLKPGGTIHAKFISDPLYIYNSYNPLSHFRTSRNKQMNHKAIVECRTAYEPLEYL